MKYEDIYGVNVKGGLKIVSNNKMIYLKLLKTFEANLLCNEMIDAVKAGNVDEMKAKAHAIKGVTANLSLNIINELIKSIENDLRESKSVTINDEKVIAFSEAYVKTMASVCMLLEQPEILDTLED